MAQPVSLSDFHLLQMIDPLHGWLLTGSQVLRTSDSGQTWTDVTPSSAQLGGESELSAASFHSPDEGWAAVTLSQGSVMLYHTVDGGAHWTSTSLGSMAFGYATTIDFVDAEHGWVFISGSGAAGSEGITLYGTTDGGAQWTQLLSVGASQPNDHGIPFGGDKTGIGFSSDSTGWITGHTNGSGLWLYVTHDDGHDWQPQSLPLPTEPRLGGSLTTEPPLFIGSQSGIMPVVDGGPPAVMRFFVTDDGGQHWAPTQSIPYAAGVSFPPIDFFLNVDDGWVTNGDTLYRTTDAGQRWSQQAFNLNWERPYQLDFVTPEIGWAVISGSNRDAPQLLKTTDGGASWNPVTPTIAGSSSRYFPETGHYVANGFLAYWEHFGGLPIFGYPITNEIQEDGLTVQYFQRARFEWHPGSDPARYDVELGLVGQEAAERYGLYHIAVFAPSFVLPEQPINRADCVYFPQTQHNLCGGFRAYWQQFGGLALYGYPISGEFVQDPSSGIVVQYFQRARFEWHPGSDPAHYDVELGRVGLEVLEDRHPDLVPQCHCEGL